MTKMNYPRSTFSLKLHAGYFRFHFFAGEYAINIGRPLHFDLTTTIYSLLTEVEEGPETIPGTSP